MQITELLAFAKKNKASDLHLSSGNPPLLRISGDMLPMKTPPLSPEHVRQLLYAIMTDEQRADYERELECDFSVSFGTDMRFRVNAFNTMNGPAAVLRDIPTRVLTLEELNTPPIFQRLATLEKGLLLVTGPTGSGKSTTLAAIIDYINKNYNKHILTVEDPIEFVHQSHRSLINQREVGGHTKSFARALKSALREDPDVILVGEMRDLETIQLAITAAETGHLVMGTLHTNSAPKTIDRIIDVFPAEDKEMIRSMLATSLQAVITQTLLKRQDGAGRIAAHEIMVATSGVRNLIREGKIPQLVSMIQMGKKQGMQAMKDVVAAYAQEGLISHEQARIAAGHTEEADEQGGNPPAGGGMRGNMGVASGF